jgi:hypothetical protein
MEGEKKRSASGTFWYAGECICVTIGESGDLGLSQLIMGEIQDLLDWLSQEPPPTVWEEIRITRDGVRK